MYSGLWKIFGGGVMTVLEMMALVYEEVEAAILSGNPPFAAIITDSEGRIIAKAHNQANTKKLAIAHAEIEAIQQACKTLGQKYLHNCILYVNAESCTLCAGAIIKSGILQVYYGAEPEANSSPDLYLRAINETAKPPIKIQGGFMADKFKEQIQRGKNILKIKK